MDPYRHPRQDSVARWYSHPALWIGIAGVLGVGAAVLAFLYLSLLAEWRLLGEGKHLLSEKQDILADRTQLSEMKLRDREQEYLKTIRRLGQEKKDLERSYKANAAELTSERERLVDEIRREAERKGDLAKQLEVENKKGGLLLDKVGILTQERAGLAARVKELTADNETLAREKAALAKEKRQLVGQLLANDPAEKAKRLKVGEAARYFKGLLAEYAGHAKEYGARMKDIAQAPGRYEDTAAVRRAKRFLLEKLTRLAILEAELRNGYEYTPANLADLRKEHAVDDTFPSLDTLARRKAAGQARRVSRAKKTGDDHQRNLDSYVRLAALYLLAEHDQVGTNAPGRMEAYLKTMRGLEGTLRDRFQYDAADIEELREMWILSGHLARQLE